MEKINRKNENNKEYSHKWYIKNKEKQIQKSKDNRIRIKKWFIEYKKSLHCSKCGFVDYRCLQFHHVKEKEQNISTMVSNSCSIEKILKEIDKCTVLCANCHSIEHFIE